MIAAAVLGGALTGATTPAVAGWQNTATVTAPVTTTRVASALTLVSGAGSLSADGSRYSISSVLGAGTGYVDLVNTSTVPATLSLAVSMGTLVGASPAAVCDRPWNTTTGACPGTATMIGLTPVAGTSSGTHTTPAAVAPAGRVHIKVAVGGVVGAVDLTTRPAVPRAAGERTTS